jgi:hypothetical protein
MPAAMAVDGAGNVMVAGTTNSDDYPVTTGAFQTAYAAGAPPLPLPAGSTFSSPPPATGYVTKVNATGTGLVWSTYFGGSYTDAITNMAIAPSGDIFVSGQSYSHDLPALAGTPDGCLPSPNQVLGFVARLAPDGSTAGPAQLVQGAPICLYLAVTTSGAVLVAGANGALASVDSSATSRLACVTDPADGAQLRGVAPGQLLSLFGTDLAPATPFIPAGGVAASSATFEFFQWHPSADPLLTCKFLMRSPARPR